MTDWLRWIELLALTLGAIGGALLFLESFQTPSYVQYRDGSERYRLRITGSEVDEYTSLGRIGAFLLALAFAMLVVVRFFE